MQILQIFGLILLTIGDADPIQVERIHVWDDGGMVYVVNDEAFECWFTGGRKVGKVSRVSCELERVPFAPFQIEPDLIMRPKSQ